MSDEWRPIIGAAIFVAIAAFRPMISKWLRKIGYTGWK